MAQLTGYVCDVCEKFSLTKSTWLKLSADSGGAFDVCSNRCLVVLGRERVKAEKAPTLDANGDPVAPAKKKPTVFSAKDRAISDEEKLTIVADAMENGVKATADKYNLPWQAVARWKSDLS